jgi:anaerobic ribonucleoside-triphosphate reductase activating protein
MNWQLSSIQYPVYNLGPGKRIGIWVQGCTLKCDDCVNKTLWSKDGGKAVHVEDVFNFVKQFENKYDGISISGGEPFQQYIQLMAFLMMVKKHTKYNVLCYSGYTLEELLKLFPDKAFLSLTGYLIDGRYNSDFHNNEGLRGSANQRLYKFENSEAVEISDYFSSNKWSVAVHSDKTINMVGVPKEKDLSSISEHMKKEGFLIDFE